MRRPLLCGCICLFVSIALWMQFTNPPPISSDSTGWVGEKVLLTGQVYQKEYRVSYGEEILILYLDSILYSEEAEASIIESNQTSKKLSEINPIEKIICELNISELPQGGFVPKLGNKVMISGTWQSFSHATNPGEFDAANYYAILGISAKVKDAELFATGERYWRIREALYQCKQQLLKKLYEAFPQKEASILAKMLLGDGSGLDEGVRDLYQNNGIVHILSISGLHITMLGMSLYKGLRRCTCPIGIAAILGGVAIVLYGIMTGFGISACRAIGMYLIHMLGEIWGKTYDMLTAMGVLAATMLIENPLLVYHSGYLLSFSSVCGVGLLSPMLQFPIEWFQKRPGERKWVSAWKKLLQKLAGGFSTSAAVTLFTLPIQLFFFFKVPVYSVIINLFVIPFMSIVMAIGILVMLLPMLRFLCPIEIGIFAWFEWLCTVFEKLPGHTWVVGRPDMWRILVYYVVLLFLICFGKRIKKFIQLGGLLLLVMLMGIRGQQSLQITFLDVGQGDCICVQTEDGRCFLFDGGSTSRMNVGERVILPFLQYQGIEQVDGVFLSHPDMDHYSGILQLMEEDLITIKKLYLPEVGQGALEEFAVLLEGIGETEVQYVKKGDCWKQGEWMLTCIHPPKAYEAESNTYSACFLFETSGLEKGEFSLLLTGDVEGAGEVLLTEELQRRGIQEVDVLKVAHHGSAYSSTEAFLTQLHPRLAVISCGENNSYGHPHKETLQRLEEAGCRILTTPKQGAIMMEIEKEIKVHGFTK